MAYPKGIMANCIICGTKFEKKSHNAITCSKECRKEKNKRYDKQITKEKIRQNRKENTEQELTDMLSQREYVRIYEGLKIEQDGTYRLVPFEDSMEVYVSKIADKKNVIIYNRKEGDNRRECKIYYAKADNSKRKTRKNEGIYRITINGKVIDFKRASLILFAFTGMPPKDMKHPTVGHKTPLKDGGTDDFENLFWQEQEKNSGHGYNGKKSSNTKTDLTEQAKLIDFSKGNWRDIGDITYFDPSSEKGNKFGYMKGKYFCNVENGIVVDKEYRPGNGNKIVPKIVAQHDDHKGYKVVKVKWADGTYAEGQRVHSIVSRLTQGHLYGTLNDWGEVFCTTDHLDRYHENNGYKNLEAISQEENSRRKNADDRRKRDMRIQEEIKQMKAEGKEIEKKTCSICGETKEILWFSNNKGNKDGKNYYCFHCHDKYSKEYHNK